MLGRNKHSFITKFLCLPLAFSMTFQPVLAENLEPESDYPPQQPTIMNDDSSQNENNNEETDIYTDNSSSSDESLELDNNENTTSPTSSDAVEENDLSLPDNEQTENHLVQEPQLYAEQNAAPLMELKSSPKQQSGFVDIDGKTYYIYPSTFKYAVGAVAINGEGYFFDANGVMLKDSWKDYGSRGFAYYGEDGKLYRNRFETLTDENNISENTYHFNRSGYRDTGGVAIDGEGYFFDTNGAMLQNSWKDYGSNRFAYYGEDGKLYRNRWETLLDEKGLSENKYYFTSSGYRATGINTISNTKYYFDEKTGILASDTFVRLSNGYRIYVYSDGKIAINSFSKDGVYYPVSPNTSYIMNKPVTFSYYSQYDGRWANIRYGVGTMANSGCAICAIAMALTALKGYTISPVDVANYLYYNTNTYNRSFFGASGSSNKAAANYWGVQCENISSYSDLNRVLADGMVVIAFMNPGDFCPRGATHAITLYGYSNGSVYVYDPLNNASTGWHSTSSVWNQLSTDPLDTNTGVPVFLFYNK